MREKINFNNYYDKTKDNTSRDEYHSMEELYTHRTMLFAVICNQNKNISWKSKLHEDDSMFENMFIAGINTSEGQYTCHCDIKFWDLFNVDILHKSPKWDGDKPEDIGRLFSIL